MTPKYHSLLPQNDLELKNYQEALNYAIDTDEIRNIALSGSYGSGKSSVINSYERMRKDKKFLHITLADFKEQHKTAQSSKVCAAGEQESSADKESTDAGSDTDVKSTVDLLEGKILNQLLHQIDLKDIPLSRFRSKNTNPPKMDRKSAIFCACFILLLLYTIFFDTWQAMVCALPPGPLDISWSVHPSFRVAVLLICLVMGGASAYCLLRTPGLRHLFKKVNIKDVVDVEVFETEDDAVFDRYLDEVLYLFEQSGADIIVFEDLDRYDVTQIFGKLKEISDLLYQRKKIRDSQILTKQGRREQNSNQDNTWGKEQEAIQPDDRQQEGRQEQRGEGQDRTHSDMHLKVSHKESRVDVAPRPVPKFFYLIRDDVFSSSDRTKFFDFIIPVIPVIATGNAYDLMLERFKEVGLQNTFDEHFLRDVSLYLSDLRLVHNIINEYILYQCTLEGNGLKRDPNRQLAMIIYKNLFPQDFEQLQHGQGYVFDILGKRDDLLSIKQRSIAQEEQQLRNRLEQSQAEHLQSVDELNALYFPFQGHVYQIDGSAPKQNLSHIELVKMLMQAKAVSYLSSNNSRTSMNPQDLRQQMEQNPVYQTRKEALENKESIQTSALNHRLAELSDERFKLGTFTLRELIDEDYNRFWRLNTLNSDLTTNRYFPLLKYLISQGYIDEHYTFYISYFRPNSLTVRDMNFRIALNTHEALDYDYVLDNPAAVLTWIDDSYFSRDELSNFTLFDYLIERGCTKELHLWLDSIECRHELNTPVFDFPIALWRQSPHHVALAQLINERMPHWFQQWTLLGLITGGEWHRYAIDTLLHSSDHTLEKMNTENWLADAISVRKDFLQIDTPPIEKIIEKFKHIGVRFLFIDFREQDAEFVRRIYEENLYRLGERTLTLWLTLYYDAPTDIALKKSYTYLIDKPNEPLSRWVEENTGVYMTTLLHIEGLRFSDDSQAVVKLLNHPNIELSYKKEYINRLDTHLDMLKDIEQQELWSDLMRAELVSFSWENIADYYAAYGVKGQKLDETLCGFLQKGSNELTWSLEKLDERIGEQLEDSLLNGLIECTELSLERYRAIWASLHIHYTRFPTVLLSDEYILSLIELGIIAVTTDNMEYIRQSYPNFMADFFLQDSGTAIAELVTKGDAALTESEMTTLLEDQRMTEATALSLLSAYSGTLSIVDTNYSEYIKTTIIDEHFVLTDIGWLLEHFNEQSEAVQSAFIRQAQNNFSSISAIATESEIIPVAVYAACLNVMEVAEGENLRKFLPDPNFEAVCISDESQKFPYTEDVHLILEYFKQNSWIDSYRKQRGHYVVTPKQRETVEV